MPALRTRDSSTLQVATEPAGLVPPALAIISPTPRAFTFPITHNLSDSPFSSPSHSPFEPDLCALASFTPPPRSSTPPLRSSSPLPRSSSPPSPPRRRKSCSGERRPRKGDDDYIKRPENAFILFRRKCCEDRQASLDDASDAPTKKQRQADLSKTISQQWKSLSTDERQYWENLAKEKKKEHEALYPNYVYRPQRARDKDGRPKARKSRRRPGSDDDGDTDHSLSFLVPMVPPHARHARSASAPTPPPYQSIQVPSVHHMPPSCPASPSLLPMISRRPFDFEPQSDFLQNMFSMAGFHDPVLLPPSSPPLDLHMQMQLQHEYAQFTWPNDLDPSWHALPADTDFDITAIPPIELDLSKCPAPPAVDMHMLYPADFTFDHIMASHPF